MPSQINFVLLESKTLDIFKKIAIQWAKLNYGDYTVTKHNNGYILYFGYINLDNKLRNRPNGKIDHINFEQIREYDWFNHIHLYFGTKKIKQSKKTKKIKKTKKTKKTKNTINSYLYNDNENEDTFGIAIQKFSLVENENSVKLHHRCLMDSIYSDIINNKKTILQITNDLYKIAGYEDNKNTLQPTDEDYIIEKEKNLNLITNNIISDPDHYNPNSRCSSYHYESSHKFDNLKRSKSLERSMQFRLNNSSINNSNNSLSSSSINLTHRGRSARLNISEKNPVFNSNPYSITKNTETKIHSFKQQKKLKSSIKKNKEYEIELEKAKFDLSKAQRDFEQSQLKYFNILDIYEAAETEVRYLTNQKSNNSSITFEIEKAKENLINAEKNIKMNELMAKMSKQILDKSKNKLVDIQNKYDTTLDEIDDIDDEYFRIYLEKKKNRNSKK